MPVVGEEQLVHPQSGRGPEGRSRSPRRAGGGAGGDQDLDEAEGKASEDFERLVACVKANTDHQRWQGFCLKAGGKFDPRVYPAAYLTSFLAGEEEPPLHVLVVGLDGLDKAELVKRVKMAVKAGAGPLIGRGRDPERYSVDELRSHLRVNRFILDPTTLILEAAKARGKAPPETAGGGKGGKKGPKGDEDAKGTKGNAGAKGDKGAKGAKGDKGVKGAKGDSGAKGDKGPSGAKGPLSPTGALGAKGKKGAEGGPGKRQHDQLQAPEPGAGQPAGQEEAADAREWKRSRTALDDIADGKGMSPMDTSQFGEEGQAADEVPLQAEDAPEEDRGVWQEEPEEYPGQETVEEPPEAVEESPEVVEELMQEPQEAVEELVEEQQEAEGQLYEAIGTLPQAEGESQQADGEPLEAEGELQEAEGELQAAEGQPQEAGNELQVADAQPPGSMEEEPWTAEGAEAGGQEPWLAERAAAGGQEHWQAEAQEEEPWPDGTEAGEAQEQVPWTAEARGPGLWATEETEVAEQEPWLAQGAEAGGEASGALQSHEELGQLAGMGWSVDVAEALLVAAEAPMAEGQDSAGTAGEAVAGAARAVHATGEATADVMADATGETAAGGQQQPQVFEGQELQLQPPFAEAGPLREDSTALDRLIAG